MNAQEQISQLIDQCLENTDMYLISFKVKPTNNYKVFIDSDSGFTLEKAIKLNRTLRKQVEEIGIYPEGDYSLEISSPGIDIPLTMKRQYVKNIGRKLEIELIDEESNGIIGRLIEVDDEKIIVEETPLKPKKNIELKKISMKLFSALN